MNYDNRDLAALLPFPHPKANKYTRGKLTLLVGSRTYPGAAGLAALASQRAGAGYTEVYVEDTIVPQVQLFHPSLVVHPWSSWDASCAVASTEKHPCAYVIGCGFDKSDPYPSVLLRSLLKHAEAPVLVDGGGLRMLSARKIRDLLERRYLKGYPTVVTPHGGEAGVLARAMGIESEDPEQLSLLLARAYGAVTVLKGPDTFISDGERVFRMSEGSAALAKAGTGDVLAGIMGALLAQNMDIVDASVLGTTLHARSGILAEADLSSIAVCPEDVISYLPRAIMKTIAMSVDAPAPAPAATAGEAGAQGESARAGGEDAAEAVSPGADAPAGDAPAEAASPGVDEPAEGAPAEGEPAQDAARAEGAPSPSHPESDAE